jgi:hypothetical protein
MTTRGKLREKLKRCSGGMGRCGGGKRRTMRIIEDRRGGREIPCE